jgi:activator of HSP90 ATPase
MPTETIHASAVLAASPEVIYDAWLDGATRAAMTGGGATSEARAGKTFTAWDGYITGKHLELQPGRRIVQAWRSTEFPDSAPDSRLFVILDAEGSGTRVFLVHTDIPQGQGASYESGWEKHYFAPMRTYFASATKKPAGEPTPAPAP